MEFYKPEDKEYVENVIQDSKIMYASMEIALSKDVNTYNGGLGILAGDTLRSSADLGFQVTGLTLLYKEGYFTQEIQDKRQVEKPAPWNYEDYLIPFPENTVNVTLEGRDIHIQPWVGIIVGRQKHLVPIIFLDTDVEQNHEQDRTLTNNLYIADQKERLKQEAVLGIGGKRVIRRFDCRDVDTFHMNEGHSALAPVEDMTYLSKYYSFNKEKIKELVETKHVFTTHTPVKAGHDVFEYDTVKQVFQDGDIVIEGLGHGGYQELNMTKLALNYSRYVNAVAKKHGEVSREMFPNHEIDHITNGIHLDTWVHPEIKKIYDEKLPNWNEKPDILHKADEVIDKDELWKAHQKAKQELISFVKERTGEKLDKDKLIIGFARRFTSYKRADLFLEDIEKLKEAVNGEIQFIFSGEAHPNDDNGKEIIHKLLTWKEKLDDIEIVFLEDYGIEIGKKLVSGVDVWQNNPIPPKEASGTSGMKAAANAIPNLSTLDGWWVEGFSKNPKSGWIIKHEEGKDHLYLYEKYKEIREIYDDKTRFKEYMVNSLTHACFFNTHRMVDEYCEKVWNLNL